MIDAQINGIKQSPEMEQHVHVCNSVDQKRIFSSNDAGTKLPIVRKMNFKSYLTLYTKINSVWLIGPNICAPITNRKKTGEKSYDLELKISWITKKNHRPKCRS